MNKKVIKYLILIALLTATLILVLTNQTMASTTVYLNDFKTNENLFCLNKYLTFGNQEEYNIVGFSNSELSKSIGGQVINQDVLKYIISDIGRYGDKTDTKTYVPQIAIWKLASGSSIVSNTDADKLIARAYAYNAFIAAGTPIPTIEENGTNEVAIIYCQTTGTYNGQTDTYTNLLFNTISVTGATFNRIEHYSGSYYKRIYTKNSNATDVTVSFNYETSRTAVFSIYKAIPHNETKVMLKSTYSNRFLEIGGENYYCVLCEDYQTPCYQLNYYGIERFFLAFAGAEVDFSALERLQDYTFYSCGNYQHAVLAKGKYGSMFYCDYLQGTSNFAVAELSKGETEYGYSPQDLLYGAGTINTANKNKTIKFGLNITLNKTDSFHKDSQGNPLKLANATFNIELENIKTLDGHTPINITKQIVSATTDNNGQIKLTGILPNNTSNPIILRITEVKVPDANGWYYKKLENPVTITLTYNSSTGVWSKGTYDPGILSGSNLTIDITNTPYIDLSGNVWQDGQLGEKVISGPDGIRNEYYKYEKVDDGQGDYTATYENDGKVTFNYVGTGKGNYIRKTTISEGFLDGVLVELYNADANGNIVDSTYTKNGGKYEFKEIPKTNNGYKVVFKYDGINYEATTQNVGGAEDIDSDALEQNRSTINSNIKTISANPADPTKGLANDIVPLSYKESEPILNVNMDGTNPANGNATDFQVEAHTGVYYNTDTNITCGLVKKEFDLAIGTDVKNAKIDINGKTTEYTYAQIMNGALDDIDDIDLDKILNNNSSSTPDDKVKYNLYLYSSDYYYRIGDYKTDVKGNNVPDDDNNNIADYEELKNIEAYVTYSVILKNQTTHNATVNEFVYYYDEAYKPYNIDSTDKYDVSIDETNRKITFTSKGDGFKLTSPNYRVEVDLTFEINKDSEGNLVVDKTATNVAEITKYSTDEGGLIDKDSAPANGITNGQITHYEDDTDEAKGLNIVLRKDETRIITGTVFDDKDKDGIKNNEDTAVNDVIVQLIEIKKIGGVYYEYIWQETKSGSNEIKTTSRTGYDGTTYRYLETTEGKPVGTREYVTEDEEKILNIYVEKEELNGNGEYKFVDFIPGNYIIRFIYGDGKTYDITSEEYKDSAESVKTYNGQDYKSTIDPNYNKQWYNTSTYDAGSSVARDNEARRLEVMTYSSTINGTNGAALASKTTEALEATWMCAETSRINIPVDADNTATDTSSTIASYNYTNNNTKVLFGDMNFGLALRPNTNIVLEKHITALKITPSGTGVQSIVDAKAEDLKDSEGKVIETAIQRIINGNEVKVQGITDGLAIIKSTADNRGFWQLATDVEELMQGAQLEVEYTYVIRNDSEADYLSKTLVDAYENQNIKPYNTVLAEIKDTVKGTMRSGAYSYSDNNTIGTYLGQAYYRGLNEDGSVPETDTLVSSRVEVFEEALNNDLTFDQSEITSFKVTEQQVKKPIYGVNKDEGAKETEINTVVQNETTSTFLTPKLEENHTSQTADWNKTITLKTTLSTVGGGKLGANLPSYIAEVVQYSNAAGRRNMNAIPGNLGYVHSNDNDMTMENSNEEDEFWAESIIITKPTGQDKLTPLQIVLVTISAVAVLGVGIVLIKKFVLNK